MADRYYPYPPSQPGYPQSGYPDQGYGHQGTGPQSQAGPMAQTSRGHEPEPVAPARPRGSSGTQNKAPIVPAGSVTGRSLWVVITIMCFLASLTTGAVYMINQSATAWFDDIASEVTVQIEPLEEGDTDKRVTEVSLFLAKQSGIQRVRPLDPVDMAALLEPWLGQSDALQSLPVPRLIALEINRRAPPDLTALAETLTTNFRGVVLDDHRHWQTQIRTVTRSLALGGIGVLILVGTATAFLIISATRSAMLSNREIVEVLHFVGATDTFIAREFERHFLGLGVKAGLLGALLAGFVFLLMPSMMHLLGGGAVTAAEIRRLIGDATLDGAGYALLGVVVVVIAVLCMFTSRYAVYSILHARA